MKGLITFKRKQESIVVCSVYAGRLDTQVPVQGGSLSSDAVVRMRIA